MSIQFQAYGTAGRVTRDNPRAAAMAYFEQFRGSRKCNVVEGRIEGGFFVVAYGRASTGSWPYSEHDVTKSRAASLPNAIPKMLIGREFVIVGSDVSIKVDQTLFWLEYKDQNEAACLGVGGCFTDTDGVMWERTA